MREYSPKQRTALVLTGSGTAGAYHAGVLKALDESGVKIDLLVGSGAGAVAAAFGAMSGGSQLYGTGGFWDRLRWRSLYRVKPALSAALGLLGLSAVVFLLPLVLALLVGLLFPLVLILDRLAPGLPSRLLARFWVAPEALSGPYLVALALPIVVLSIAALALLARGLWRDRRRLAEALEASFGAGPAESRLRRRLWEGARGAAPSAAPASDAELGRRYVALVSENFGEPGFRELILRTADLETGCILPFVLLRDEHRAAFAAARSRGLGSRLPGIPGAVDLRGPGYEGLLLDAVLTGLLPPMIAPVRRVEFPRGGLFPGETHRLADATLAARSGIGEALAAGAEQILLVTATPEDPAPPNRRRGQRALLEGMLMALERQAVERDVSEVERINRMVETLGHRTEKGERAWQDPATGRVYRSLVLYVVRPDRRALGPLEMDGALDPTTEVLRRPADVLEQGYRDAYRMFVEPVVGSSSLPHVEVAVRQESQPVEL